MRRATGVGLVALPLIVVGCGSPPSAVEVVEPSVVVPTTVVVEVDTPRWEGKMLYIALFQSAEDFLERDRWIAATSTSVTPPLTRVVFEDVPAVPTAASGFIDLRRDENLTRNVIGIPLEPWGFSNDLSIFFSRPTFEDAAVELAPPESTIRFAMGTSLDRSGVRKARAAEASSEDEAP